jgi:hypothetical protein
MSININIIFKPIDDNNNNNEILFTFPKTDKIKNIKTKILEYYNTNNIDNIEQYNYIDLENITTKIYKDYGKLFFDKGILPSSNDNYKLEDFSIIDNSRIYTFIAILKKIEKIEKDNEQKKYQPKNYQQKNYEQKNYEQKNYEQKNYEQKNYNILKKDEFIFKEEDFPPLC